jgi:acetyl-CoA carboxylase carboxyl transferase subunit alpha
MRLAEKFGFPVICFIDTPGASANMEAEERGQGHAIAENLLTMANLRVPIVAMVIGEGGSGGALAIGVADRLIMLEHAIYSVASPEASAAILWRDAARAPDAARAMKITAADMWDFGVVDEVVREPYGGAHLDAASTIEAVGHAVRRHLGELQDLSLEHVLNLRYEKYRCIGKSMCWQASEELKILPQGSSEVVDPHLNSEVRAEQVQMRHLSVACSQNSPAPATFQRT